MSEGWIEDLRDDTRLGTQAPRDAVAIPFVHFVLFKRSNSSPEWCHLVSAAAIREAPLARV